MQPDSLKTLLVRSLETFGDKFNVKHVPLITQNGVLVSSLSFVYFETDDWNITANAQTILLTAGHLRQLDPSQVKDIGRTGVFLNAVSNRLAASSNRARFLGMIVGTAISEIIEEPGKSLKFDLEEMQSEEACWYLSLTKVQDRVGLLESIKALQTQQSMTHQKPQKEPRVNSDKRPQPRSGQQQRSKIVAIEEIDDSSDASDEDEDLIPYEKPDDDDDDDDEDPTLVQRNKPIAPV